MSLETALAIAAEAFAPPSRQLWGIEVEQLVTSTDGALRRPSEGVMSATQARRLPCGSRFTTEPGGQAELSTAPARSIDAMLDALNADLAEMQRRLVSVGFGVDDRGLDGSRQPERILHRPRYAAMESFFASGGSAGTWMMCNSASLQINVSHDERDPASRWRLLHQLAPVLIATFANSPGWDTDGVAWKSLRQANWWAIDPTRTSPPAWQLRTPEAAWGDYALTADVMLIHDGSQVIPMVPGTPFADWIQFGHPLGWPSEDDFRYHLTTLFPPVRPRGWLEVRYLDALAPAHRVTACLLLGGCLTAGGASELERTLPDLSHLWVEAARVGLQNTCLARAADLVFEIASAHLSEVCSSPQRLVAFRDFQTDYVAQRRCPADDRGLTDQPTLALDHFYRDGELVIA